MLPCRAQSSDPEDVMLEHGFFVFGHLFISFRDAMHPEGTIYDSLNSTPIQEDRVYTH